MVHIRKSIDIISPLDGKRYDSISKYEKSIERAGCNIMEDKVYRQTRERLIDEANSAKRAPEKPENHVHINFNNDTVTTSYRKDIEEQLKKGL